MKSIITLDCFRHDLFAKIKSKCVLNLTAICSWYTCIFISTIYSIVRWPRSIKC